MAWRRDGEGREDRLKCRKVVAAAAVASALTLTVQPAWANDSEITPLDINISPVDTKKKDGNADVVSLSSDILFDIDKHELSDNAKKKIGDLVQDIPKNAKIAVGGHTDNVKSKVGNKKLSELRAKSVADAVKAARKDLKVDAKGFADSKPVADNGSDAKPNLEGRAQNRRVEIRY